MLIARIILYGGENGEVFLTDYIIVRTKTEQQK